MLDVKTVTVPVAVVQPLKDFMTYKLKGAFSLNKLVAGCTFQNFRMNSDANSGKRRRIIKDYSKVMLQTKTQVCAE